MSKSMWIIIILITILMLSSYWFSKGEAPPWVKCKESLFEQVVLKKCTPSSFIQPNEINNESESSQFEKYPVDEPTN